MGPTTQERVASRKPVVDDSNSFILRRDRILYGLGLMSEKKAEQIRSRDRFARRLALYTTMHKAPSKMAKLTDIFLSTVAVLVVIYVMVITIF